MIYTNRVTGEKIEVRKNALREFVLPDGSKMNRYQFNKIYKLDKIASKPFRAKMVKAIYAKTL